MQYDQVVQFAQKHFTDGLVLVIGSGLSAAEGLPGMPELAQHLTRESGKLPEACRDHWLGIEHSLNEGLEAALLKNPPNETLESWIVKQTAALLASCEARVMAQTIVTGRQLRLTSFLHRVQKPIDGIPILTTNYDRLIEVACERARLHVDTTAIGVYGGAFDHRRSCMGSARKVIQRAGKPLLDHYPRAVVLKPHGSLDWYKIPGGALRCSVELDAERLIITPGLNKYRAGYEEPFDKHRELANDYINRASRLLIIGYGFNDDHLQVHLLKRIQSGVPTIILTRTANARTIDIASTSPQCLCLSRPASGVGVRATSPGSDLEHQKAECWDLGEFTKEFLP